MEGYCSGKEGTRGEYFRSISGLFQTENGRIRCEVIEGCMRGLQPLPEEGKRLLFLLGTLLQDHFIAKGTNTRLIFGPVFLSHGSCNLLKCDLITTDLSYRDKREKNADESHLMSRLLKDSEQICHETPELVVNIMSDRNCLYECMDKVQAYSDLGAEEYWLIDMQRRWVYVFFLKEGSVRFFSRVGFDKSFSGGAYKDFCCCISSIMWEDGQCLKELEIFYRLKQEMSDENGQGALSESGMDCDGPEANLTAEKFYKWLAVRKKRPFYKSMTELLMGTVCEGREGDIPHQRIQGNLYFAIKSYIREIGGGWQICFSPMAVELRSGGILDSVVRPDIFLLPDSVEINDNICWAVPMWVIEIADPDSAVRDYVDKVQLYHYHGVREYWIINHWKRQVMLIDFPGVSDAEELRGSQTGEEREAFGQDAPGIYRFDEIIESSVLPGLQICMDDVLKL